MGTSGKFDPGKFDRRSADRISRIVKRVERAPEHSTGGPTHQRPRGGESLTAYRLLAPLTRTTSAEAELQRWNLESEEWETNDDAPGVTLWGDFFRGYGFAGDLVFAGPAYGEHLMALGAGHFFIRGKIGSLPGGEPAELASGGSAPLNVWEQLPPPDDPEGALDWRESDPLKTVTVREAIGLDAPLPFERLVLATWHEQGQFWIASHTPCSE